MDPESTLSVKEVQLRSEWSFCTSKISYLDSNLCYVCPTGNRKWKLQFYPRGILRSNRGFFSLYLCHRYDNLQSAVHVELSITSDVVTKSYAFDHHFKGALKRRGIPRFVPNKFFIDRNGVLLRSFFITCTVSCRLFLARYGYTYLVPSRKGP